MGGRAPTMAAVEEWHGVGGGVGGPGSPRARAKDPVPGGWEGVRAYQSAVTRQFSVWDPVVLTVGRIAAGTKDNIIPDDAFVDATLRTFSAENRARAHDVATRIAEHVAQAHGMTAEVTIGNGYPVTVNDVDEFAFSQGVVVDLFGADRWVDMVNPEAGSEDMSFVLDEVPGAYLNAVSYTHLRAHETVLDIVCRLLLDKKNPSA